MECPDRRQICRKSAKKFLEINKSRDPMQIHNVARRNLLHYIGILWATVVAEQRSAWSTHHPFNLLREVTLLQGAPQFDSEPLRRLETNDVGIGTLPVLHQHFRIVAQPEKPGVQAVRRARRAPCQVPNRKVGYSQAQLASINNESGLYTRPSGSVSRWKFTQPSIALSAGPTIRGDKNPASSSARANE